MATDETRDVLGDRSEATSDAPSGDSDRLSGSCPPSFASTSDIAILAGQDRPDLLCVETLASVFRDTANAHPIKHAMRWDGGAITFSELDRKTDALAAALQARGAGPGMFVGVWMDRGPDLHTAILAVTKSGAAFVPLDGEAPPERVQACLADADAILVIVDAMTAPAASEFECPALAFASLKRDSEAGPPDNHVRPDDPAYAIFTSGSTGRPKGVAIAQRNVCHFIRSEAVVLGLCSDDVVFQGFSVAFDMSIEEVWISWLVGATLHLGMADQVRAVDRLPALLRDAGVTVFHAVPTLAALFEEDVASIRLLNVGGEACTPQVLERWMKPGRQIFNTYGPTETTVTATAADLSAGGVITIGTPLPNYVCLLLNEKLEPCAPTERGELCIAGPGVGMGYLGRAELTAEKFIPNPIGPGRLYRTGDLASINEAGDIAFHGRIDDQVKIRGYRVELGEIENVIASQPGIAAAAVLLEAENRQEPRLVAFVLADGGAADDTTALKKAIGASLPSYMVPSRIVSVEALPRLTSGKIDRKALGALLASLPEPVSSEKRAPETPGETSIAAALAVVFPGTTPDLDGDFFNDLGGHSLLVARFVSRLRHDPLFANLSLREIYTLRTGANIARHYESADRANTTKPSLIAPAFEPSTERSRVWCGVGQALGLIIIYSMLALIVAGPFVAYSFVDEFTDSLLLSALAAVSAFTIVPVFITLFGIVMKWVLVGRYREGDHPLWGSYYLRFWLASRMTDLMPVRYLAGTPLYTIYFRLLGAKIGHGVHLSAVQMSAPDLVSIGRDTSFGTSVEIGTATVEGGVLRLRKVQVGEDCLIGSGAVLGGGCVMGDRSELGDLSYLAGDQVMAPNSVWQGSPARLVGQAAPPSQPPRRLTSLQLLIACIGYGATSMLLPVLAVLPMIPGFFILNTLDSAVPDGDFSYLFVAPLLAIIYTALFVAELVIARWIVLGTMKPGVIEVHSNIYIRKWFVDALFEMALDVLHPMFATLYLPPLYRWLGAKLGRDTEISTATSMTHSLLEIGDDSFIADGATLGDHNIRHGRMTLQPTKIGTRAFVGNGAVVPDGTVLDDDTLLGVLSLAPPVKAHSDTMAGSTWFGVPALQLPRREVLAGYDAQLTFRPSPRRRAARWIAEGLRIVFAPSVLLCALVVFVALLFDVLQAAGVVAAVLAAPFLYLLVLAIIPTLLVLAAKWLLVGRYKPGAHAMWTPFVWASEAVTANYEAIVVPLFLQPLRGTPFLPMILRLFGVKIGKGVWLDTTDFTEFDQVQIGDFAEMANDCGAQTHLFEDRIMKVGPVRIGARAYVGDRSVVLYDGEVGDGARLTPLSLVMKGERIPSETVWSGSPAEPIGAVGRRT